VALNRVVALKMILPGVHPDSETADAEAEGRTFAALFHLDRLLAARLDHAVYHLRRGHANALRGRTDEADRDYARAAGLVPLA
jgi:hypothetical protein